MPFLESEHLDPEPTTPDPPDGYDPDGWEPTEWWDALRPVNLDYLDRLRGAEPLDDLRPADFDDEERRP